MKPGNFNPRWAGATVVCIASGPSLTPVDVEVVRAAHARGDCKVIVVNREFLTAPWADVLYAADFACWRVYIEKVRSTFKGELWTIDPTAARTFKLNQIARAVGEGYSSVQGAITTGSNSGFQAVHLASYWGAKRILLLGYDMQRTYGKAHHFGMHDGNLCNGRGFPNWIAKFKPLVKDLKKIGVEILNATRETALPEKWIPRCKIEDML